MNRHLRRIGATLLALAAIGVGLVTTTGAVSGSTSAGVLSSASNDDDWESGPGIVITRLLRDGPAARAGVARGDILLEIDGQEVNSCREIWERLGGRKAGDQVKLAVRHGDETREMTVTLGGEGERVELGIMPCHRDAGSLPARVWQALSEEVRILAVEPGSPAEQAGLAVGDVITAVDGQSISSKSLTEVIAARKPGDTVTLEVRKPGEEPRQVSVQLGEHPDRPGTAYLGVRYQTLPRIPTADRLLPFGGARPFDEPVPLVPGKGIVQGIIVREVSPGSPAEAAGLQPRDVITAIDGNPITKPTDLSDAVKARKPGDTIKLTVVRAGEAEREVEVTLGVDPSTPGARHLGVSTMWYLRVHHSNDDADETDRILPDSFFDFDFKALPIDPGRFWPDGPRLPDLRKEHAEKL